MSVIDNVIVGAQRRGNDVTDGDAGRRRLALAALGFVGLASRALDSSLSYGHQRLVEIARSLAGNPLLLDEPGAGLNHHEKQELVALLKRLRGHGLTVFIIDHDMNLVEQLADHITVLNFGRLIADGAPSGSCAIRKSSRLISARSATVSYSLSSTRQPPTARSRRCAALRCAWRKARSSLLGANGAGKSTTLRAISGLVQPRSGTLRFAGRALARLAPEAIVRLGIAHVPEGRRIFPGLTVRENMVLGGSNCPCAPKGEIEADVERMFGIFPDIRPFAGALGWTFRAGSSRWWRSRAASCRSPSSCYWTSLRFGLARSWCSRPTA